MVLQLPQNVLQDTVVLSRRKISIMVSTGFYCMALHWNCIIISKSIIFRNLGKVLNN